MNSIDILLAIVIALSLLNGYRRGFVHGVLDLAGWVVSLLAGLRFYHPVAQWLGPRFDLWSEVWDQPIAFVLVALVASVAGPCDWLLVAATTCRKTFTSGSVNQVFGVMPGIHQRIDHCFDPLRSAARSSFE